MNSILTIAFYVMIGLYIHALISPNHKLYVKPNGENRSRSSISKFFLSILVVIFLLIGITAAPSQAQQAEKSSQDTPAELHKPEVASKDLVEKTPIPFESMTKDDPSLNLGTSTVIQEGENGEKTTTYTVTYTDGKETSRVIKSEIITKKPVSKIIHNGTYVAPVSNCNPNYSGCVENSSYDLDCADVGTSVTVLGYDEYGLDRDGDGYGCESY